MNSTDTHFNFFKALLFLFLFTNSQFTFDIAHNPLAIPYAQEIFLGFLLSFFLFVVLPLFILKLHIDKLDAAIATVTLVVWVGSAAHAYLRYGQPIYYGLIEDRRSLGLLAYFPLVMLLRSKQVCIEDIFRYILTLSTIFIIYGVLVSLGLAPTVKSFALEISNIRAGRMNIGLYYMILAFFICLSRLSYRFDKRWAYYSAFFFFSMAILGQTRQLILGALIIALGSLLIGKVSFTRFLTIFTVTTVIPFLLLLWLNKDFLISYYDMFSTLSSTDYINESARILTSLQIFSEFSNGDLWGHGALSLMWKGGFHRLYGENFFLADVGVIGTMFRFGILAVPILIFASWILIRATRRLPKGEIRRTVAYGIIFSFLLIPTAGLVVYRGFFLGILLAISAYHTESLKQTIPTNTTQAH
jgi:hypothetical protein